MPTISPIRTETARTGGARTDGARSGDARTGGAGSFEAVIDGLGAAGDGILHREAGTLFVAGALPGERVLAHRGVRQTAILDAVIEASPDRVTAPCRLFGRCGGCALQHLNAAATASFKRALVVDALRRAGFAPPDTVDFMPGTPGSRRRMDLALRRIPGGLLVGLHPRGGGDPDQVVDLVECPVLEPSLFALITALRPVLLRLGCLRRAGSLIVNSFDSGPDLLLATEAPPDGADRARLADFAREASVPRISWRPLKGAGAETLCSLAPVHHTLSGVRIAAPPGGFLQATVRGERAIVAAVLAALPAMPRQKRVIELFAGCGTLSFALAARFRLLAVEGQADAASCLREGARGLRLEVVQRDLARQPLLGAELGRAAAIVLDPPFAGAGMQMHEIARSGVARVVMVSCNPRALEGDGRLLHEAGYRLERLTVIDQFHWSGGVESVAAFGRPARLSGLRD